MYSDSGWIYVAIILSVGTFAGLLTNWTRGDRADKLFQHLLFGIVGAAVGMFLMFFVPIIDPYRVWAGVFFSSYGAAAFLLLRWNTFEKTSDFIHTIDTNEPLNDWDDWEDHEFEEEMKKAASNHLGGF